MANPATREQMKQWCLRALGKPVLDINVDDTQLEDRIDEAIEYYRDYHFDGTERTFVLHTVSAEDITNRYLTISSEINGIINLFDVGDSFNTNSMFNLRYQITLNDLFDFSTVSVVNYVNTMRHLELLEEIFVGKQPLRYSRHMDRMYVDMDWGKVTAGSVMIYEAYRVINPDTYTQMWNDRWLKDYTTQLFKRQWGTNMKKFQGVTILGGISLDGQTIYQEANDAIIKMEEEMISSYSMPVFDMIG
tara:strand:+ start:3101 stop:3841 length:741 start_codon:yes stop_codon:yes gene_type:complete